MEQHEIFNVGEQHEAPVGASFSPGGWIAPFMAAHIYGVGWVTANLQQEADDKAAALTTSSILDEVNDDGATYAELLTDADGSLFDGRKQGSNSGKFMYYYRDPVRASALCDLLNMEKIEPAYTKDGKQFNRRPQHLWRLETLIADTLSLSEEGKEKFDSSVMMWEIELKAPRKNSPFWFTFHGLAAPCAVSAYAQLRGWEVEPFDISELTRPTDEVIVNKQFQLAMIGDPKVGFEESKLWERRAKLWKQLGEDDPKVTGAEKTESERLGLALSAIMGSWNNPVYCRVIRVPSPKEGDTWDWNNRSGQNSIPVITDFYTSKELAQAAANAERVVKSDDGAPVKAKAVTGNGSPAVPEQWATIPEEWKKAISDLKAEIGTRPLPVIKAELAKREELLVNQWMVTAEDVLAWWDQV